MEEILSDFTGAGACPCCATAFATVFIYIKSYILKTKPAEPERKIQRIFP